VGAKIKYRDIGGEEREEQRTASVTASTKKKGKRSASRSCEIGENLSHDGCIVARKWKR